MSDPKTGPRVVVLGAGLSGLAAAHRLAAAGAIVTVLERGHRPGGRATTDERDGFVIDSAPHLVSATDSAVHGLIRAAGLGEQMLPLRPVGLAQARSGHVDAIDPSGTRGIRRIPGVAWRQGLRLHRLGRLLRKFDDILTPSSPERAVRMDDRSIADFIRTYFGPSVLERWVEPLIAADAGGEDVHAASRQLFLLHQVQRAFAPTGTLRGGLGVLAERLASGLDVRLEHTAIAVLSRGGVFEVTASHSGGEAPIEADAVVSALPASVAARVLAPALVPAERDVLGEARTLPAIVASVALDRLLAANATRVRVPADEGGTAAVIGLEPGGERGPAPDGTQLATVVARSDWSREHLEAADEVIEKALVGELERLYPGASSSVRFVVLRRHREAFPRFEVGRYRSLGNLLRVEADRTESGRRLFHAGDHIAAPTLEGAVGAGQRAAARCLASFH
jgi:oxygen-dependent protoporphyrinogen oxidase